jgi:hypothetical protein
MLPRAVVIGVIYASSASSLPVPLIHICLFERLRKLMVFISTYPVYLENHPLSQTPYWDLKDALPNHSSHSFLHATKGYTSGQS